MKRIIFTGIAVLSVLLFCSSVLALSITGMTVTPENRVVPKDGSATFKVEGTGIEQIKIAIYDLSGKLVEETAWIDGTEYTFDFTGYAAGAYIYVVYARAGSEEELVGKDFIYVRVSAEFKFEAGTAEVGANWQSVSFSKTFSNPVVIIKSVEGCGDPSTARDLCDYLTPRIRNVTSTGFEVMLQAIPRNSPLEGPKTVPYIVVEAGRYTVGGFEIEAGHLNTSNFILLQSRPSTYTYFKPKFEKEPVVITSISSFNGSDPATTRNKTHYFPIYLGPITIEISIGNFRDGFVSIIDEPGWDPFLEHKNEEISYIAITPGVGVLGGKKVYVGKGDLVSHEAKTISFPGMFSSEPVVVADMQRMLGDDWSILRYASLTNSSVKLMVAEKNGGSHVNEPVGYILVGEEGITGPTELIAHFVAEPTSGASPLEVHFDASGSFGATSYEWDFGDGETGTGVELDHTYTEVGEYSVKLTVRNDAGSTATSEKTITVTELESLVASIKTDKEICPVIPCEFEFDASESTGAITSYEWDFGDGSPKESGADLITITHTYNVLGSYTVTLTVYDASGNSDSTSIIIGVGCRTSADCLEGDGCFNGMCLHPLLTINKSENQIMGFKGEEKEAVVVWTLTNVGDYKAVVTEFSLVGCGEYDCILELTEYSPETGGTSPEDAELSPPVNDQVGTIFLQGISITNVYNEPNPFEQGSTTTFIVEGTGIEEIKVKVWDSIGSLVYESDWVDGTQLIWDGTDNDGAQLRATFYLYKAYARSGTQTAESETKFVYIEAASGSTDEPKGTISMSADPNPFEQGTSTTISLDTSNNWLHAMIEIYDNGTKVWSATADAGADGANYFSWAWNGVNTAEEQLPVGTYRIEAKVWNTASDTLELESPYYVEIAEAAAPTPTPTPTPAPTPVEGLLVIEPMESVRVLERVRGIMPPSEKKTLELGLVVQYTDEFGLGSKTATNHRNVEIVLANLDSDKFHVKLKLKDQTACIGWNDVYGVTGEHVAPRVLFDWSFNSGYGEPIAIDQCDKKPSNEFVYCDATQFSIELLKKLHRIDELAESNEPGIDALTEFKSYLIADSFSEDFRKDFDYYYNNSFLAAPSWYKDLPRPWSAYFTDFERLAFEPSEIQESGLYNVTLEFVFEGEEYEFFSEGNPSAIITVKFEKVHDVGVEVIDSPFYHLPFDGLVGTLREDEDGKTERKGYGLGFVNENEPLRISYVNDNLIATTASTNAVPFLTSKQTSFEELNLNERGEVLVIDLSNSALLFSPSYAMPIILGIESVNDQAQGFYVPYSGDSLLGIASAPVTYWTGIATTPFLECRGFMGEALPYNLGDLGADSYENTCFVQEGREHAFGFMWDSVFKNNERIFLKTIFYSAFDDALMLASACADPEDSIAIFASPFELSSSPTQFLALQEPGTGIETFKDLIEKISSEEVCMSSSDGVYTFFWNAEKVEEKLESAKDRIEEQWSFNWENYECNPFK